MSHFQWKNATNQFCTTVLIQVVFSAISSMEITVENLLKLGCIWFHFKQFSHRWLGNLGKKGIYTIKENTQIYWKHL